MADLPLQKIAISGPTLASIIQRFSFSTAAVDGLLFGHVAHVAPSNLSDDSPSSSSDHSSSSFVATVTGFICSGSTHSFYDSAGRIDSHSLTRLLGDSGDSRENLIGWFSGRRRTSLRPSLREFLVTASLSASSDLSFRVTDAPTAERLSPCVFLLFSSPIQDQTIHTHEYRAHQFRSPAMAMEPKSVDVVNIGPAFRGHYGSFSPSAALPLLPCDMRASPMSEDEAEGSHSLGRMKQVSKAQRELDLCAEGLDVSDLRKLLGNDAASYTAGLENLYEKMLAKVESLASLVEKSSARVHEQECSNRKLRNKVARSAVSE